MFSYWIYHQSQLGRRVIAALISREPAGDGFPNQYDAIDRAAQIAKERGMKYIVIGWPAESRPPKVIEWIDQSK